MCIYLLGSSVVLLFITNIGRILNDKSEDVKLVDELPVVILLITISWVGVLILIISLVAYKGCRY